MPNLEDLQDQYGKIPRSINQDLRSIVHERGETKTHLPMGKLGVLMALTVGIMWFLNNKYGADLATLSLVTSPFTLGAFIWVIRSSSPMVQLEDKLRIAPLVLGRVVEAPNHLHRPGDEEGLVHLVFCLDKPFDGVYLKDAAKHLRSAQQSKTPPSELTEALAALTSEEETTPIQLPAAYAGESAVYLAAVKVNPKRLPKRKINDGLVPLLANVKGGLIVHV